MGSLLRGESHSPRNLAELAEKYDRHERVIQFHLDKLATRRLVIEPYVPELSAAEATYLACLDQADFDDTADEGARMFDNDNLRALQNWRMRSSADMLREEYEITAA